MRTKTKKVEFGWFTGNPIDSSQPRWWRRANTPHAEWFGVEPDIIIEHPPLRRNAKGQVNFSEKQVRESNSITAKAS